MRIVHPCSDPSDGETRKACCVDPTARVLRPDLNRISLRRCMTHPPPQMGRGLDLLALYPPQPPGVVNWGVKLCVSNKSQIKTLSSSREACPARPSASKPAREILNSGKYVEAGSVWMHPLPWFSSDTSGRGVLYYTHIYPLSFIRPATQVGCLHWQVRQCIGQM
jgi:hypothetical protein